MIYKKRKWFPTRRPLRTRGNAACTLFLFLLFFLYSTHYLGYLFLPFLNIHTTRTYATTTSSHTSWRMDWVFYIVSHPLFLPFFVFCPIFILPSLWCCVSCISCSKNFQVFAHARAFGSARGVQVSASPFFCICPLLKIFLIILHTTKLLVLCELPSVRSNHLLPREVFAHARNFGFDGDRKAGVVFVRERHDISAL
jgi:hypothetical protein